MSGWDGTLALRAVEHPLAWLARWVARLLDARRERRRRERLRTATMPMGRHLLRDLGLVEADARRLGLLG